MTQTTYTIRNGSVFGKAFRVHGGHKVIAAGAEGEVTTTSPLSPEQIAALAADGCIVSEGESDGNDTGYKAEHHGGGKFRLTHGETIVLKGLTKAQADAFNAMSAEDKEAFAALSADDQAAYIASLASE